MRQAGRGGNFAEPDLGSRRLFEVDLLICAGLTVNLRIRLATDTSTRAEGWYVDDVRVFAHSQCQGTELFIDGSSVDGIFVVPWLNVGRKGITPGPGGPGVF